MAQYGQYPDRWTIQQDNSLRLHLCMQTSLLIPHIADCRHLQVGRWPQLMLQTWSKQLKQFSRTKGTSAVKRKSANRGRRHHGSFIPSLLHALLHASMSEFWRKRESMSEFWRKRESKEVRNTTCAVRNRCVLGLVFLIFFLWATKTATQGVIRLQYYFSFHCLFKHSPSLSLSFDG